MVGLSSRRVIGLEDATVTLLYERLQTARHELFVGRAAERGVRRLWADGKLLRGGTPEKD